VGGLWSNAPAQFLCNELLWYLPNKRKPMSNMFTQEELSVLTVKQVYRIQKTIDWLKIGGALILLTVLLDFAAHMGWLGPNFYLGAVYMDSASSGSAPVSAPTSRRVETKGGTQASAACPP
jgi:hypothetical protein